MDLLRLSSALQASGAAVFKPDPVLRKGRARLGASCLASKRRGFGPEPPKKGAASNVPKEELPTSSQPRKSLAGQPMGQTGQAPGVGSDFERRFSNTLSDRQFMKKLEAVKRSALEQRKAEERRATQAINYDAPIESERKTIGLGTKVGAGIGVAVFGLVFALGDFLPSRSANSNDGAQIAEKTLSVEEKATLETRLQDFEATLRTSPDDLLAIEGASVTSAELGKYKQATDLLEKLVKEKPEDPEAYRLLGDVKYKVKDFEGSAASYRSSLSAFGAPNFEALRGLTNALLAAEKPNEAVQVLLKAAEDINSFSVTNSKRSSDIISNLEKDTDKIDPVQVQLLLGKAYSDWGHVGDAVSVYDRLISNYPDDFRGYLAKGIILKENGKFGDAERMFIQARFFAPEKAKILVDRYSRR